MSQGGGTTIAETNTISSRVVFINSRNATAYFNQQQSNFEFIMDEAIVVPNHHSILMSLMSAEIPYSFYAFNDRNNTIQWEQTDADTIATYNVGVDFGPGSATNSTDFELEENGNYTPTQLAEMIDNSNGLDQGVNPIPFFMNYSEVSQKFSYLGKIRTGGGTNANRVTLLLRSGNLVGTNDMVEELGFKTALLEEFGDPWFEYRAIGTGEYRSGFSKVVGGVAVDTINRSSYAPHNAEVPGTPPPLSTPLVANNDFYTIAPYVADLNNQIRTLFIRTNLTTNSVMDSFIGGGFSNILARVPINTTPGNVITITPANGDVHKLLLRIKAFNSITIRLTNHRNETIDLNGLNFDIALKLDFIENQTLVEADNVRELVDLGKKEEEELETLTSGSGPDKETKKKKKKKTKKKDTK